MKRDDGSGISIQRAEQIIKQAPENPGLLNALAWAVFESGQTSLLERALEWANKSIALSASNNGSYQHTRASIQCALGKMDDALKSAGEYLMDLKTIRENIDDTTELFIELSARSKAQRALQLLIESPSAQELEPLAVGMRLFLGESVKVAAEVIEIGNDVAKRIRQRQKELDTVVYQT